MASGRKKKFQNQYEPTPSNPAPAKPLWEVEVETSPFGPRIFKVRASTDSEALSLAVEAAHKHPDVMYVLDVKKPRKALPST